MLREIALTSLAVAAILFPLDFLWLKTMRPFYESQMGGMLLPEPRIAVAVGFYLLYAIGVAFFAVHPNLLSGNALSAAAYGAFFGFVAYGVYDLTNYATLRDFPFKIMIVDLAWGTFLTGFTACSAWLVRSWFA